MINPEAQKHLEKAKGFLARAQALDSAAQPEAVVHLSYYAMYHAAVATLLLHTGSAPSKHTGVISQFGLLVKDRGEGARQASRSLSTAFSTRLTADYDVGHADLTPDAQRIRAAAGPFLQFCEDLSVQK